MAVTTNHEVIGTKRRVWHRSCLYLLVLGLIGVILAAFSLRGDASRGWDLARLMPAVVYGLVALIVLLNVYWQQHDALIEVMGREVMQQKIEAELNRELSLLDPTTEVYNRRYLRMILSKEASRARRYSQGLAVIMTDVVGFRRVNESVGHAGGDVFLREVAHLIQNNVRNSDYVVRFSGDVFLLILPDTDVESAAMLARRFDEKFIEWTNTRGFGEFSLRLAAGIAGYGENCPVEQMLAIAEDRMRQQAAELKRAPAGTAPASSTSSSNA